MPQFKSFKEIGDAARKASKQAKKNRRKNNPFTNNLDEAAKRHGIKEKIRQATERTAHETCAVTDPFCPAAKKYTRGGITGQTINFTAEIIGNITTDASGWGTLLFCPSINTKVYKQQGGRDVGPPATITLTNEMTPWSDVQTGQKARVTSAGATWWDTVADSTGGGTVIAHEFDEYGSMYDSTVPISLNTIGHFDKSQVASLKEKGTWVTRPSTGTATEMSEPFVGAVTSDSAAEGYRHTNLALYVEGPASTKVMAFRLVINYEIEIDYALFGSSQFKFTIDPRNQVSNYVSTVAQAVDKRRPSFWRKSSDAVMPTIKQYAVLAIKDIARSAGTAALGYAFGPTGLAIGYGAGKYIENVD